MPDRAVVDETDLQRRLRIAEEQWLASNKPPAPRALVAISPDRQWLVALGLDGEFIVQEWDEGDDEYRPNYVSIKGVKDTGQSADAVLAAFLEGRYG